MHKSSLNLPALASVVLALMLSLSSYSISHAAPPSDKELVGAIEFDELGGKKVNTYKLSQDETIDFFTNFAKSLPRIASGEKTAPGKLSDDAIAYLATSALYCSMRRGLCPFVMDALLEAELANAQHSGKVSCSNMTRFWKFWIKTDLEKRMQFEVRTADIPKIDAYKKNQRPKYLKCKDTISKLLAAAKKDPEAFRAKRYKAGGPIPSAIKTTVSLLRGIRKSVPNIFIATGVRKAKAAK